MAYNAFTNSEIQVGKAIKKELWQKVKDNFDDHETRLAQAVAGSSKIEIFNIDFLIGSFGNTITGVLYHEALQDMNVIEGAIQIFDKDGIVSGVLSIDVKKNTTPDNTGMVSVFTTAPSINFATANNYDRSTGTLNPSNQSVLKGEILRLDVTSLPVGLGKFRIILIGEV
jgi:hypothetical protein